MATYVFSDVHGHVAALKKLFERVSPADGDTIVMLGDMIDRGPDPVGVMRFCRDLTEHGATVLRGNHEDLMLSFFNNPQNSDNYVNWAINGGATTAKGLDELETEEMKGLLDWVGALPLSDYERVGDRLYLLTHAGIMPPHPVPKAARDESTEDATRIEAVLEGQNSEDLMWVRQDFWGHPTGLVGSDGHGIIVVAGHTPTPFLDDMADRPDRSGVGKDGLGQMVKVGACEQTGGVADRWDIDAGCAGGHGFGKLLLLKLDDGQEFYEPVQEGE
jgi:serine/threonine protein phosphatase 1